MPRPIVGYVLDGESLCPECAVNAYHAGQMDPEPHASRDLAIATDAHGLPDTLVSADSGAAVAVLLGNLPSDFVRASARCADCDAYIGGH